MRVLVVGTSGQLATELHLAVRSPAIELLRPEKIDLTDGAALTALLGRSRPELVVNAAAYTAVDKAESEPERAHAVNALGPQQLAAWCDAAGAALFHVSTDYVFDGHKTRAYVESDPTSPLGVYGQTKLAGEIAVRQSVARHLILRTSWVFSAHGQNFVKTIVRLARERDELRVVADQIGRPTAAKDLASALLQLAGNLAEGREPAWGTYHFANHDQTSWHGFAEAIVLAQASYTGRQPRVLPITTEEYPTPAKRPANSTLDTTAFEQAFGFVPRSWREALGATMHELFTPSSR